MPGHLAFQPHFVTCCVLTARLHWEHRAAKLAEHLHLWHKPYVKAISRTPFKLAVVCQLLMAAMSGGNSGRSVPSSLHPFSW